MKKKLFVLFIFAILLISQSQIQAASSSTTPLYQVTVVQNTTKAINYRNLKGSVEIDFNGTVLLPDARGIATIRNKDGVIEIKAKFENLTVATQFGHEYLTYIFWAISPDGRATNLGELIVKDGESQLNVKTPLQALSLIVTAEPYFAVSQPSNVVVLENAIQFDNRAKIELIDAKYELLPRGEYTKNVYATDLMSQVIDAKTPLIVYQARNAVWIAKASGAEIYAAESFKNAERLLALSETKVGGNKGQSMTAREVVQSAEDSRAIAVKRQADAAIANEISSANSQAVSAIIGQAKAEQAKGQSDIERANAIDLANSAAQSSVNAQADAKVARAAAEESKGQADIANNRAQKAEDDKTVLRAQLFSQLNSILQTRDTARGLIVNMSDALFQTGSAELLPTVREKLAKIAGVVSSNPGLKLDIEGHTDNIGSNDYNQQLSEKRAQSARDYLISQGVPSNSIVSRGFGKNVPVESNDTLQGRQKNRRVELVVSGEAIGSSVIVK